MPLTLAKRVPIAILAAVLCMASHLWTGTASAQAPPDLFKPVHIASGATGTPGTVAWSPDGSRLAYITEGVAIYEIKSGESSSAEIKEPYFISWADQKRLIVLHGEGKLSVLDGNTRRAEPIDVPSGTVAAYPAWDGHGLFILVQTSKVISIGVEVAYGLQVVDPEDGSIEDVFSTSRILPRRYAGTERLRGWMSAGPAPVSGEVMLLEFIVPPNAAPYTRALLVDPFTKTSREVVDRYRDNLFKPWGAWSPLGGQVALVDERGSLNILSLEGGTSEPPGEVSGLYPAWDPAGGRIYFGGYLIDEHGIAALPILSDAPESAAFFSPGGNEMAFSSDGKLWLLVNMARSGSSPLDALNDARKKTALLRELFTEGLLTETEYRERMYSIIVRRESTE